MIDQRLKSKIEYLQKKQWENIFLFQYRENFLQKQKKNVLNIKTNTNKYIYEKLRTSVTAQRKRKYEARLVLAISLIHRELFSRLYKTPESY